MSKIQKQHRFGWMNNPVSLKSSQFEISPLTNFAGAISQVIEHPRYGDWLEMPQGFDRFELPATHYLEADSTIINNDFATLLISVFGFLHGLNLKPCGVGHLHRTPHKRTLVEFIPSSKELENVLNIVIEFYHNNGSKPDVIPLTRLMHERPVRLNVVYKTGTRI
jgi:hypothetical protein